MLDSWGRQYRGSLDMIGGADAKVVFGTIGNGLIEGAICHFKWSHLHRASFIDASTMDPEISKKVKQIYEEFSTAE